MIDAVQNKDVVLKHAEVGGQACTELNLNL